MRWKLAFMLGVMVTLMVGCGDTLEPVEIFDEQRGMIERYSVVKGTNTKQGTYQRLRADGQLLEEATYENGVMIGEQKIYENNELYSITNFNNGQYHGPYQTYYPGGNVNVEGEYVDDVMTGKWKRYYPDGQIMEVVTFKDNEENGPFVEFYPNGNVKAEGDYLNGDDEHGELFLYDINGILIKRMMCDRGICRTIWVKEGREGFDVYRAKNEE